MPRLGAHWTGEAVHFTLWSAHATAVELCLFETETCLVPRARHALKRSSDGFWHLEVPGLGPGTLYGYRVHGPYEPQRGHRFNPSKLLVDPYARAITGEPRFDTSLFGFDPSTGNTSGFHGVDSAHAMPKCVVVDGTFDWQGTAPPRTPWRDTVIYEAHVKGLTRLHPDVEPELRGTYLGLASPPIIDHLKRLGITAVELQPVHQIASEPHLLERGMRNYWGYSTLGFFAPHAGYATGGLGQQVHEFKTMVRTLHAAGLEVLIDVVYNHTAEGNRFGPTLSFKGIDNVAYYRTKPFSRDHYVDVTGCGNTLDIRQPMVERLVLDSLRYWVEAMGVDGFRFDLAPALGRDGNGFRTDARLFRAIADDPLLSRVKLIAEPWDVGPNGYRLGGFPEAWAEWNDRYRDTVRRFWRGDGQPAEFATRLAGSSDVFGARGPLAGIAYVTSHDGFTLEDLVSYQQKHNHANGEDNRDGHHDNLNRNWGVEGPTDDPRIAGLRRRAKRNFLATLALSQGVPMLLAGDELGHSQRGNNNPYCQDNALTWIDWEQADTEFLDFVVRVLSLRRRLSADPRAGAFTDTFLEPDQALWLHPEGHELTAADWSDAEQRALALLAPMGLLLLNGSAHGVKFHLPEGDWEELLDTARENDDPDPGPTHRHRILMAFSAVFLCRRKELR